MDPLNKEILLEFFLESDSVSTLNRVAVAAAGVAQEYKDIVGSCRSIIKRELRNDSQDQPKKKKKRTSHSSAKCLYEDLIQCSNEEYYSTFKIKRFTVAKLLDYLIEHAQPNGTRQSIEKKFHVFLWLLTNTTSYSEVGSVFGLHKSTVSYVFHEMSSLLSQLDNHFIKWPSFVEQHLTRVQVSGLTMFPNCVGFIDACRLKVGSKKKKNSLRTSVLLQAVCDEKLKFIDIHVGTIGDTRKAKVFKESPLSKELKNCVDFENHILGDSSYKLQHNLMTPFTSNEVLTSDEMAYNQVHCQTRAFIGSAFSQLQSRFKKINHIDLSKRESIKSLIIAACVLHNFILSYEPEDYVKSEMVSHDEGISIDTRIVKNALEKRQFLCNYINYLEQPTDSNNE